VKGTISVVVIGVGRGERRDLLFHRSWLRVQAPQVADVYDSLLRAMREEAGAAMTHAWNTSPITRDEDMPLGNGYGFPR
jgi:hypothetical protein